MHYISEERFVLELPTSHAMLTTARPSCYYIIAFFCFTSLAIYLCYSVFTSGRSHQ